MRRFRAFLGIGLALGLSGCAGNHQCFLKRKPCLASEQTPVPTKTKKPCFLKKLSSPAQPCLASEQAAVKTKKPCFLKKLFQCKKCGKTTPVVSPTSWQAPAEMPCPCGHVMSSEVPVDASASLTPASPPDRVAGYFPTLRPRGGSGVVEANWPDPLGVRTPGPAPGEEVWRTSGEGPASDLQETSARMTPAEAEAEAAPRPAEGGLDAESTPTAVPNAPAGAPNSLPSPPNPAPYPPIEPSRPKAASLRLEYENATARAGRPYLPGPSEPTPRPRRAERTDAAGDLALPAAYYASDVGQGLVPAPRDGSASEPPRRVSILGRLARRIRGDAPPCDPEPEPGSARGEAGDVAQ